ncbi:MAG: DUF1223 domain-containing protein [Acidobacteriota bacterium]
MRRSRFAAAAVVLVLVSAVILYARATEPQPPRRADGRSTTVVLELFTSQGCSSCPPADRLLTALGGERRDGAVVIPLAYHVDYWDHLGWKDPFSSASWSARQNRYAASLGSAQVYTPQLIVNGTTQLVGNDERAVRRAIERQLAAGNRGVVFIDRLTREGRVVRVDAHAALEGPAKGSSSRAGLEVIAALFQNGITTAVVAGENGGRKLADDYIVRWEAPAFALGIGAREAHGTVAIPVDAAWSGGDLGVVLFLQDRASRSIYGAVSQRVPTR